MRTAYTLIELIIVMAVLAVMAAIALPNIVEVRAANREAEMASRLATEVLPAMHQYRSTALIVEDTTKTPWRTEPQFPGHVSALAGEIVSALPSGTSLPISKRPMLSAEYRNQRGPAGTNTDVYVGGAVVGSGALVSQWVFATVIDTANNANGRINREDFITVIAGPVNPDDARRAFGFTINPHHYDAVHVWTGARPTVHHLMQDGGAGMFVSPAGYATRSAPLPKLWSPNRDQGVGRYVY